MIADQRNICRGGLNTAWIMRCVCGLLAVLPCVGSTVLADSASVAQVNSRLAKLKQDQGAGPGYQQFIDLLMAADVDVQRLELKDVWQTLTDLQQPQISATELHDLIAAKRDSIVDIRFRCRIRTSLNPDYKEAPNARPPAALAETTFAFSGSKLYLNTVQGDDLANPAKRLVEGYDSEVVRTYKDDAGSQPIGSVQKFDRRGSFFDNTNLLGEAMIVDSMADYGQLLYEKDVCAILKSKGAIVFEKLEAIDGVDCLVVSTGVNNVYLDPERDFSVVQYDEYKFRFNNNAIQINLDFQRKVAGLTDYGNGLWLPDKSTKTMFAEGKMIKEVSLEVVDVAVNKGIDDSLFVNIVPDGTLVSNVVDGAVYIQGDVASIESTLSDLSQSPNSSRSSSLSWLLPINVVALVVVLSLFFIRWRLAKRQLK